MQKMYKMKQTTLAKRFGSLFLLATALSVGCKKTALNEQSASSSIDESQTAVIQTLFVSAADTGAAVNNLWRYNFLAAAQLDSTAFASNAKDGNGVYYCKSKDELYQVSRKNKTVYVFSNASNLTNPLVPSRSFTDTSLSSGREIAYDNYRDILYIANNSDSSIRVYKNFSSLSGMVTGAKLKIQGQPWGIDYDPTAGSNKLIVVIDQAAMRLDIFDAPQKLSGSVTASRSINISDRPNGTFSRLHGVKYDASKDVLLVTEIGEAAAPLVPTPGKPPFNADGGIYIIKNATSLINSGGTVAADNFIYGANTFLGNPVDITLGNVGSKLYVFVAEKANKKILSFNLKDNGNVTPTLWTGTSYSPEAITPY